MTVSFSSLLQFVAEKHREPSRFFKINDPNFSEILLRINFDGNDGCLFFLLHVFNSP